MLAPATMRLCNNLVLAVVFGFPVRIGSYARCAAIAVSAKPLRRLHRSLWTGTRCARRMLSRLRHLPALCARKVLATFCTPNVEEVVMNATVLEGNRLVRTWRRENFEVLEDGAKQTLISFQHSDLPVSIALVVDNSGSMSRKRPSVNKSALDLIQASNPQDEALW